MKGGVRQSPKRVFNLAQKRAMYSPALWTEGCAVRVVRVAELSD